MPKVKKNGTVIEALTTAEDIDEAERVAEAADMAAETMTGDIRDFILDRLRHEQSKRPWHERSEADQRMVVYEVEAAVREHVRTAVEIMAGHGRRTIRATVESVTVKGGYKAVLTTSRSDENRHALSDAVGYAVLLVIADPEEFTGERAPAEIVPDQANMLPADVAVVHSDPDGASGNPLH